MFRSFNEISKLYSAPFITGPSNKWILNIETTMTLEEIGGVVFPVVTNNKEYESSWVCSPYNGIVTYSKDELFLISNRSLRLFLKLLLTTLGGLLKLCKINKNICINNFLFSTNPYPNWQGEGFEEVLNRYKLLHPKHAFMFRSLNDHNNKRLIQNLRDLGFMITASRQVYIFDNKLNNFIRSNTNQNDRRTLAKTEYKIVSHEELSEADYPVITHLYSLLYLKKHSKHNPNFSEGLIAYWHQHKILTMIGLRDGEGTLQGIVGLFETEEVTTVPMVGYNTELSPKKALYRILMHLAIEKAHKSDHCFNLSSGAADFKLARGGQPFIEYTAIYTAHLPLYRRLIWQLLGFLLNKIFTPLAKKYKL